ncbi:YeeE/YedE family protein [Sphingomonas sp. 37zxx]|uniref:YeeE/YedE family protein n=1 Tax=Sphingomonas sp. 37zxx TaxID=1550073 RepID=UPI00053BF03B|nr:YeeE/YedE thiosulfate transporter family protein [Sphingomonas sp. 37zxx]
MFPAYSMPLQGLIGGLMIGTAAAIMLLGTGRIAGVSGMAARAIGLGGGTPRALAIAFVVGLPIGAALVALLIGPIESRFPMSLATLAVAGLVVGIGTRLGSGCTSGHGVCGMSRLSKRSIVATITFMATGFATVAIVNGMGGGW